MVECPKCHYIRQPIDRQIHADICPSCGIVYAKWIARQNPEQDSSERAENSPDILIEDERQRFRDYIFFVPEHIDPISFYARLFTLVGVAIWGFYFISAGVSWEKIGGSFLHNVNLAFHEFGHIFFMPFGHFMMILGGSLFQCSLPLVLTAVFVIKQRDNFAGSITLWWCGQNFIDVAPYIDDAQYRSLPLVGGGGEDSHDWGNLLTMMNLLPQTHTIARSCSLIGAVIIMFAILWGFLILRLQKKNLLQH